MATNRPESNGIEYPRIENDIENDSVFQGARSSSEPNLGMYNGLFMAKIDWFYGYTIWYGDVILRNRSPTFAVIIFDDSCIERILKAALRQSILLVFKRLFKESSIGNECLVSLQLFMWLNAFVVEM